MNVMKSIARGILVLFLFLAAIPASAQHQGAPPHRGPQDTKQYLDMLDSPERDKDQKPSQVVDALMLKPGMVVADLGSGSGYFTRRFAETLTDSGKVYAVDVEPEMLAYTEQSLVHMHIPYSAEFILARPDNPKLPIGEIDLIFVCNVYHHLENRPMYFEHARSALKPGGRVAIVDFYHDDRSGELGFPKRHLVPRDTVIDEMTKAGFRLLREHDFLPKQYFLEFVPAS